MSFQKRLQLNEFLLLAEMDMPKGVDISDLTVNARRIKGRVDAVVIPDMANGVMKMSAMGGGLLMNREGLEPIIQICCRDRNRISLQGDLLSAHALGLQNVMVVPGQDISYGDQIEAKAAADLDELGLLKAIGALQEGKDLAGFELKGAPAFNVGATMSPVADDRALEQEMATARQKIQAGAKYLITPPVFDIPKFEQFMSKAKDLKTPIIATVYLLKSVGMARYMAANMPGIHLDDKVIGRIRQAKDRADECVRIAGETVKQLKDLCQGVCIVTLGWEFRLPAVLDYAGI